MGRLSKAKIDQIHKLRRKGYLQKEVAEKVGVNVKTVKTYDPLRGTSRSGAKPTHELGRYKSPTSLLSDIRSLADWVSLLFLYTIDPDHVPCPRCLFSTQLSPEEKSGTVEMNVLENDDYECPECGYILTSPPKLSRRLLIGEVREELIRDGYLPDTGETRVE